MNVQSLLSRLTVSCVLVGSVGQHDCNGQCNGNAVKDVCGVCNGSGAPTWTYYADLDGDGLGNNSSPTTQSGCTLPTPLANTVYPDNTDVDDTCNCGINTDAAVANGGLCRDDLGVCGGDGYTANCTDLTYIFNNYPETMKCDDMDCDGNTGTDTFGYYYGDNDGDGIGVQNSGYYCSSAASAAGVALLSGDISDDCYCTANTDAACYDCLGNCKYLTNGSVSTDFIGDDAGKTNACSDTSRLGCDACDVCNGVVPTWYKDLDVDKMVECIPMIKGKHDFTTFRSAHCQSESPVKTLKEINITRGTEDICFGFVAQSFLHHQIRSIVGSLKLVGEMTWSPEYVQKVLDAKDRSKCGALAPPDGLYFMGVKY